VRDGRTDQKAAAARKGDRLCATTSHPAKEEELAELLRYTLQDGTEVHFETAESSAISERAGSPEIIDGGALGNRLRPVALAAEEVTKGLRQTLTPDEIELSFGIRVSGEVNWWYFAKVQGESTLNVKVTWTNRQTPRTAD
jgi:Trypsin-co-occurring domain 1